MKKELQDFVWQNCLPKEFKEEVKKMYATPYKYFESNYSGACAAFNMLFGKHNLTSDAEVEVELLHVTRQKVMGLYANAKKIHDLYTNATCINTKESQQIDICNGVMSILDTLFGSKCLPDNVESSEPNVDSLPQNPTENCDNESHISTDCDKPAEPKFKIGDKVKDISSPHDDGIYKVDDIKKSSDGFIYHIQGLIGISNVKESDLEPYTEPKTEDSELLHADSVKETRIADEETHLRNLSQETANCDKQFDNILKDSFSKERRLNIAASIAAGWLARHGMTNPETIAMDALAVADALIIEVEKTNNP